MTSHWSWRQRLIAEVVWPSFLTACLATGLFFAKMDPLQLLSAFVFQLELSATAVYSIGFFFFWLIAAISSLLTGWLIRTARRRKDYPVIDERET
ncbi:MAG: hypothetical protein AAGA23_23110 [Pseudomonadota bacterium]